MSKEMEPVNKRGPKRTKTDPSGPIPKGLASHRKAAAIGRFFASLNQWEASIFSVKE